VKPCLAPTATISGLATSSRVCSVVVGGEIADAARGVSSGESTGGVAAKQNAACVSDRAGSGWHGGDAGTAPNGESLIHRPMRSTGGSVSCPA
jgi:hypothetical protein